MLPFQWNQFQSSFCPWNHFPYLFQEQNCFRRTSYCRKKISKFLQSIQIAFRGGSINLHTIFVNGSNFWGEHTTHVFRWMFFQAKLSDSSISQDIDFPWFSIFDKKLRRWSIAESGSFGFLIVEVTFYGLFINHISFHGLSFKETSFLATHLFDNGQPGIHVSEMVLVLVSPLTKAVSMDPTSMEHNFTNFPSIEFNLIDFKSFRLLSMVFFPIETRSTEFYSM